LEIIKDGDNEYRLLSLSELKPTDEGKDDVLLKTIVAGNSEVEHFTYWVNYKCPNCTNEKDFDRKTYNGDWRKVPTKWKCDRCNIPMYEGQVNKGQLRKVLLSEQGVSNPIHLTGFIYGDDIHGINPGTKLNMSGILRSRKTSPKDLTFKRLFDVTRYTNSDDKPIIPTDEEIEMFRNMDKQKLIDSFAPHIRNMYLIKEGLLLCCIGGLESEYSRGDINALLLGDPGVAKTQLLKFVTKIIQKSDYVSGKSASGAGLFGGVDNMADGTRMAKPGTVVMCNGGVACIDELEKMNPADRAYAHEVMESQKFSLRKIGIDITWTVKVSIIAAANPKKSRWNPELTINENVNLPDSLYDRFGLVFLIRDIPNAQEDRAVAEHIRKVRAGELEIPLDVNMITKFINYAKTISPKESQEAGSILSDWWVSLRQVEQLEGTPITGARTNEDLHRLASAYARLDLSNDITNIHANKAIKMMNDSLRTLGMNTPGEKNASIVTHLDKNGYVKFIFGNPITHGMAIVRLMEKPIWFGTEDRAKDEIDRLINKTHQVAEIGGELVWV
jgi:replicative DNA helicase Mcm